MFNCIFNRKKKGDPPWLVIALKEIGVKEIPGKEHNPRVLEYQQACTLKAADDETAWCSSFVNWCVQKSGWVPTHKANARSWLKWGYKTRVPQRGAVVVFWRGSPSSWKGHVGFFIKENAKYIWVLGGNQNNKVCIRKYPREKLLQFRWMCC